MKIYFTRESFPVIGLVASLAFVALEASGYAVMRSRLIGSTTASKYGG